MPCARCGTLLVFIADCPTCPSCENIGIVPQREAVKILESMLAESQKGFMDAIAAYDQDDILETAFAYRELAARNFVLRYAPLDLGAVIRTTSMIKTLLRTPRPPAGRKASAEEAMGLVRSYGTLLDLQDGLSGLRAGTCSMIHMGRYRLDDLRGLRPADFPLCPNEAYAPAAGAFAKHGIMTEAAAEQKVREMRRGWKPVKLGSKRAVSLEQTVSTFYPTASMLTAAFAASRAGAEAFALPDGADAGLSFLELKKLISDVPAFDEGVTWCHAHRFDLQARGLLGGRAAALARNLVAGRDNPGAFPLFLRIGGKVFVSHFFGELFLYALLPVLHKDKFDCMTRDRGRSYERTVQKHFEGLGFKYFANVRNGFEIDGIAVADGIAFVIEAKCWATRRGIGGPAYPGILARKVRGAIDGMQYESDPLKDKPAGVPLPRKVEWVRENRRRFGIADGAEVVGLLVANTVSPVREHGGCLVAFIDDLGLGLPRDADDADLLFRGVPGARAEGGQEA